jgi:hypothetical protein
MGLKVSGYALTAEPYLWLDGGAVARDGAPAVLCTALQADGVTDAGYKRTPNSSAGFTLSTKAVSTAMTCSTSARSHISTTECM